MHATKQRKKNELAKQNDVGDKFSVGYWPLYCVYVCIGFLGKRVGMSAWPTTVRTKHKQNTFLLPVV